MSIESTADWEVSRVVRLTPDALAKQPRPGVTTGELDATAARSFAGHGARSAPAVVYGFPGAVRISVHGEIVPFSVGWRVSATPIERSRR